MIAVILLGYLGCVYAAFKIIKIKVTPVSVATAILIGVFLMATIISTWNLAAPMTEQIMVNRHVIPLLTSQNSKEVITKIYADIGQPVKKGDPLYEVETDTLQYSVDQLTAEVAVSQQSILELEAALAVADAKIGQAKANRASAKAQYDTEARIQKADSRAVAKVKVEVKRQSYLAAQAAVDVAVASRRAAEFALANAKSTIKVVEAKLETAKLDLERAVIRAPADGRVMNWQPVVGTMTTTLMASAQGTFMDMAYTRVIAVFPQNLLKNVESGDTVEMVFKSFPNHVVSGKVDAVLEFTGEGQLQPTGVLPDAASIGSKGFLAVSVVLDDEDFARELPLGGAGAVAIYTRYASAFHVISKITLRIKGWTYYLPV